MPNKQGTQPLFYFYRRRNRCADIVKALATDLHIDRLYHRKLSARKFRLTFFNKRLNTFLKVFTLEHAPKVRHQLIY